MKPSIPKGTRDFSPTEMARRNFILDTITTVYKRYGFQQIETPAMENLSTLEGKYGDEGDKLLFRVLNSGPVIEEVRSKNQDVRLNDITEKGLRYDLTVPFARYVVMHQNEITFPFKRFQVQPVWRADRPQKGRYREFVQCDADVIGSTSLLNEVELVQIMHDVFKALQFSVSIKFNNRKFLNGVAELAGISSEEKFYEFINAIDNFDKVGWGALEILKNKGWTEAELEKVDTTLKSLIIERSSDFDLLNYYESLFQEKNIQQGLDGIKEVRFIKDYLSSTVNSIHSPNIETVVFTTNTRYILDNANPPSSRPNWIKWEHLHLEFDIWLARGLNYYTGSIFEVKVADVRSNFNSSILGGGRYDDLTGIFGLPNVSGVGISFGVDRIYDVMDEMKLFDELNLNQSSTQVLFVNFGKEEEKYCLKLLREIRNAGINAELYPDAAKMKKQMSYADANKIPFVVLVGEEEIKSGMLTVKNMKTGEQEKMSAEDLKKKIN